MFGFNIKSIRILQIIKDHPFIKSSIAINIERWSWNDYWEQQEISDEGVSQKERHIIM